MRYDLRIYFIIYREPLGKWEIKKCPPTTRLMFVPILGHFNFKVFYYYYFFLCSFCFVLLFCFVFVCSYLGAF